MVYCTEKHDLKRNVVIFYYVVETINHRMSSKVHMTKLQFLPTSTKHYIVQTFPLYSNKAFSSYFLFMHFCWLPSWSTHRAVCKAAYTFSRFSLLFKKMINDPQTQGQAESKSEMKEDFLYEYSSEKSWHQQSLSLTASSKRPYDIQIIFSEHCLPGLYKSTYLIKKIHRGKRDLFFNTMKWLQGLYLKFCCQKPKYTT